MDRATNKQLEDVLVEDLIKYFFNTMRKKVRTKTKRALKSKDHIIQLYLLKGKASQSLNKDGERGEIKYTTMRNAQPQAHSNKSLNTYMFEQLMNSS
eukprot:12397650-Karenia_brevis.AAC.1